MATSSNETIRNHEAFIWSVADLLRGDYKQSEYGRVILPLTVLRRLDCVLEPTRDRVRAVHATLQGKLDNVDPVLFGESGVDFYNLSEQTMVRLLNDPDNLADHLKHYILSFSADARDAIQKFGFDVQIDRLQQAGLLYKVVARFCDLDLHPAVVSNVEMGYLYEELIRRFSELSNETAGEHFTPREVIHLMVELLFVEDDQLLSRPGVVKTMYDPACGTGGMLSVAEARLRELHPEARPLEVYGQELNAETYAVCRSDMLMKAHGVSHIVHGNSFTHDGHEGRQFDYMLANPPFGVEWKKYAEEVKHEAATKGFGGRFGAGLPRINDGSFLFLQHMISKMKQPEDGGSRLAIVFNGSPLFTGAAGSGESEIRRWIIEHDWLEAVVALPDQLFYNTGISTYFWVVTNRKRPERKGKVQLVDARDLWTKMRKSLGEKRKAIAERQIAEIVRLHRDFEEHEQVKIVPNESFGFMRITVERPLRLRWEVTDGTLAALDADKKVQKLDDVTRAALRDRIGESRHEDLGGPDLVRKRVASVLRDLGLEGKPLEAAIVGALAVRDPEAEPVVDADGNVQPDPELRDQENVPLPDVQVGFEPDPTERLATIEYRTAVQDYFEAEVLRYVPDAWIDHTKTKLGYEIPFTRKFYKYVPPRPLAEIDAEIKTLEAEIQSLLNEVTE